MLSLSAATARVALYAAVALVVLLASPPSCAGAPVLMSSLSYQTASVLRTLTPSAQSVALSEIEKMGNFEPDRMFVNAASEGKFYVVEDLPTLPVRSQPSRLRRMVSGQAASAYTAEGVPIHHSLPGASKTIYLNFVGMVVSGTAWNSNGNTYTALPFNPDGIPGLSAAEKATISRIWNRVAEDYAPFQVDVTTERPASLGPNTAVALITPSTSAEGTLLPAAGSSGGLAYVNVFGASNYISTYAPAWIYYENLGKEEDYTAEAVSHEIGHNLGLSHDGTTTSSYFGGMGSGTASWAPIMGAGYDRAVTQFSKGEYANANNKEDDLAIIANKLSYRGDDVGNTVGTAAPMSISGLTATASGIIEQSTDVDVYYFDTGAGAVSFTIRPFHNDVNTPGANLDVVAALLGPTSVTIATSALSTDMGATVTAVVTEGRYYLTVSAGGNPLTPYSAYGSMGQYVVSGTIVSISVNQATTTPAPPPTTRAPTTTTTTTTTTTKATTKSTTTTTTTTTTTRAGTLYYHSMQTQPDWTFPGGGWSWGKPTSTNDPKDSFVIGNTLTGNGFYAEPVPSSLQAVSPSFSTVGRTSATLTFDRYLGVLDDDLATIHVCVTGGSCIQIFSNRGASVLDFAWASRSYDFPASVMNKPAVQVRFGLGPTRKRANGNASASYGWNIKNVLVTAR